MHKRLNIQYQKAQQQLKTNQLIHENNDCYVLKISLDDGDLMHWKGWIIGPPQSAYQGAIFKIDIQFTLNYPYSPPVMKFQTKIWHPNVNLDDGFIWLNQSQEKWSPALTVLKILKLIVQILIYPNLYDLMNIKAGQQYQQDKKLYQQTVKQWVKKYAQFSIDIQNL